MITDIFKAILSNPSSIILIVVLVVVLVVALIIRESRINAKTPKKQTEKMPYLLKESVLTNAEFEFSKELAKYVLKNCMILTKVSLHDVFDVDKKQIENKEYLKYFNKYSSKHVDFLICDRITFKPLYGVELDDSSHNALKAIEKDEFINKLYSHVGLKLVRIKWKKAYTQNDFIEIIEINNSLSSHQ